MRKLSLLLQGGFLLLLLVGSSFAQGSGKDGVFPSLDEQLSKRHDGFSIKSGTALDQLIRENQNFEMLRASEASDKRGLPPWLRVWWRKNNPEMEYPADDPTGGYPLVLKEILEWMYTHQDLQAGPGLETKNNNPNEVSLNPWLPPMRTVGANIRTSGAQTSPRSESDIRMNYFDTQKIIVGSNNIGGSGQQGMYFSSDQGLTWGQTVLPFNAGDTSMSDPTVDWTNDGRAYSSTLGIVGGTLRLRTYFSTDNGATWSIEATPSGTQTNVDKQLHWTDKSATSPFFGRQYIIWHNGAPAFVNRRTAGEAGTWLAAPIQVSGAESTGTAIGGDIRTNAMGDVFGFYPTTGNRRIVMVKSTDGGETWAPGVVVATTFDSFDIGVPSFANRRAFIYASGSAWRTGATNNVYVAWSDLSGDSGCTAAANEPGTNAASTCKMRIWFSRSIDGGTTWQPAIKVNNQAGLNDQFNQAMTIDETTGKLVLIYNDTVGDATRRTSNIWAQSSDDGGVTWTPAEKVTSAATDETIAGADSGNQYGDYNGVTGYNGVFFPSWTDRRSLSREEIWTAKVTFVPSAAPTSSGQTLTAESCGIGLVPDPGDTMSVTLPLGNGGNLATTNLVATLRATGGITNPSAAQSYGVIAPGAAEVTRNFTFTVNSSLTCGAPITLTWDLTDGASNFGTVVKTFGTGSVGASTTATTSYTGAPVSVPDNNTTGATIPLVVSGANPAITDVNFRLDALAGCSNVIGDVNASMTHSFIGDLAFTLTSPAGTSVSLIANRGTGGNNYCTVTLDDDSGFPAASTIPATVGAVAGNFAPESPLSAFDGQDPNGTWTLKVVDNASLDTGTLNRYSLTIASATRTCSTCSATSSPRSDFDGDGKTDLSVFRPSEGNWYLNRSTAGFSAVNWGISTDTIMPGDFDGDGKADEAVYRPSATAGVTDCYILKSSTSTFQGAEWGTVGDVPVIADFDGDNKDDVAIYRPSTNDFFVIQSSNGVSRHFRWGIAGDIPVPGDFDGDGKAEFAVFRPSNGTWYYNNSTGGAFVAVQWGATGDIPVFANYDGDAKDDIAVYRPSTGFWYLNRSTAGSQAIQWGGVSGDVPVPGDYDGDGKYDTAVYRAGTWFLNGTTSGAGATAFGAATDRPTPRYYLP